ncbi:hypothetical protein PINS_up002975 [Pythium insidiosum]|nr:hypothetical protein PINS_up002975 [Pythium insidiosum]
MDARRQSRSSSSAELIADAIRQNMAARQNVLLDLESALSLPVATARGSLSSHTVKLLNRLRSLTLSIVEMVQFFESQPTPALATGWTAMRHEFAQYLLRVAASDVDALVRFPALTAAFDSLGVSVVRNPLLDGVTLDASELLLCSCQRLGASTAASATSSSLTQLVLHRLEAFALRVRREFPSWQVLPHDRVAAALLVLLDLETKHNASRLLPSYLRPEGSSVRGESASRRASLAWADVKELDVEEEDQELFAGVDKRRTHPLQSTNRTGFVAADVDVDASVAVDVAQPKPQVSPQRSSKKSKAAPFDRHATIASLSPTQQQASRLQKVADPKIVERDDYREPTPVSPTTRITVDASTITMAAAHAAVSTQCSTTQTSARVERVDASTLAVPDLLPPASSPRLPPLRLAELSAADPAPAPSSPVTQPPLEPAPARAEIEADSERAVTPRPQPELSESPADPLVEVLVGDDSVEVAFDASSILAQIAGVVQSLPRFDTAEDHDASPDPEPPLAVDDDDDTRPPSPLEPGLIPTAEQYEVLTSPLPSLSLQEEKESVEQDPPSSAPSSPDLARILALCRDVQLAAVDLTQRLQQRESFSAAPPSLVVPPRSLPLSTRFLESELKMLRRYVRSWRSVVLETRFAVESLRLLNAERRVVRFLWRCHQRRTHARVAAIERARSRAAVCLQHAWRDVLSRRRQRRASDAFHRQHRAFARCRFFLRLQRRRRRRVHAQRTLATWWRRRRRARRAQEQRNLEQQRERERRDRAALRLQHVMSEHTLRSQLARARAAADELQERHASRLRDEAQRREQLDAPRRQELRALQRRWQDADAERQRLQHEQRRLLARQARRDAQLRRREAARTIAQFVERGVLRRRLAMAQQRCATTERVVHDLETRQARREAQDARARAERALQASVLRWQVARARATQRRLETERETLRTRQARERIQRFLVQHVVARSERSRWRQRLQHERRARARQTIGAFALSVALQRRLARQQAEARALAQALALEREKLDALALERAMAESRLQAQRREQHGTLLQLWVQSHWRRRRQERERAAQAQADAEARERAAMAACDAEQRALDVAAAAAAAAVAARQQQQQQQQEVRLQVRQNLLQLQRRKSERKTQQLQQKQERETRVRRVHRVLSESVTDVQHSRRLAAVEHHEQQQREQQQQLEEQQQQLQLKLKLQQEQAQEQALALAQERERQQQEQQQQKQEQIQRGRAVLAETLLASKFLAEDCAADAMRRAVVGVRRVLELLTSASTVRQLRIRRIERRVVARWREMVATRRCVVQITQRALWSSHASAPAPAPAPAPAEAHAMLSKAEEEEKRISEQRNRALRLYELRCNASARKVQRCWRAWRLRLRRHRRQLVKAEEDRLVTTMKMARYASSKRLLIAAADQSIPEEDAEKQAVAQDEKTEQKRGERDAEEKEEKDTKTEEERTDEKKELRTEETQDDVRATSQEQQRISEEETMKKEETETAPAASHAEEKTETEDAVASETLPTETETETETLAPSLAVLPLPPPRSEREEAMETVLMQQEDQLSRRQHATWRLQRWWRRDRARLRVRFRVAHSDGVAYTLSFRGGRAVLSSALTPTSASAGLRFRLDRHATRHLLLVATADDACHPPSERLRVVQELVADVAANAQRSPPLSSSRTVDVDEMELPRFAALSRQLAKTRSIYRRKLLLDARAADPSPSPSPRASLLSSTGPLTIFDAVESGSVADAEFLLRQGADLSAREPVAQRSALHMLAFCVERVALRVEMLEFLVQRAGLSLHALDANGESPVVLFAANGQLELLTRALRQLGGDWRSPSSDARSALHAACEQDHAEVAAAIHALAMSESAPPSADDALLTALHRRDRRGQTPLHALVARGLVESARQLLAAEPQLARRRRLLLELEDDGGCAPLARAVSRCHLEMVETLLQSLAGCRLDDWRDARGRGLLHHAVLGVRATGAVDSDDALDLLSLLADAGVELEAADERGDTALHYAALGGRTAVLRHLLALGADARVLNSDLESPAQLAAANGHHDCHRLLLASGGSASSSSVLGSGSGLEATTPSAGSYYHPHTGGVRGDAGNGNGAMATSMARGREAFSWDELHREVQLVDESGHFSSEEEDEDEDH